MVKIKTGKNNVTRESQPQDVFDRYFGEYAASKNIAEKRMMLYRARFEKRLWEMEEAIDLMHPNHLIYDFLLSANDALADNDPITPFELHQLAHNIAEGHMLDYEALDESAMGMRLSHFMLDGTESSSQRFIHTFNPKSLLNAKPSLSYKALCSLNFSQAQKCEQASDILKVQVARFQEWLLFDSRMFFEQYTRLRQYNINHEKPMRITPLTKTKGRRYVG